MRYSIGRSLAVLGVSACLAMGALGEPAGAQDKPAPPRAVTRDPNPAKVDAAQQAAAKKEAAIKEAAAIRAAAKAEAAKLAAEKRAKAREEAAKAAAAALAARVPVPWPPALKDARHGAVVVNGALLLQVPEIVREARKDPAAAPFTVAKTPPTVDFTFHQDLGSDASLRRLWSSWGDIGLARDGKVYLGIGDHGHDAEGDARCFIYVWDPEAKTLKQIADMNKIVPPREGQPAWSKVHAKIDEGPDGKIYFSCTLNAGNAAGDPKYGWTEHLTGGQLYCYDPATGQVENVASLPPKRCTATSAMDLERGIWWCNLEAGEGDTLYGLDLKTMKPVFQAKDGTVGFNRAFALTKNGDIYFNGLEGRIARYDAQTNKISDTKSVFPDKSPGMRSACQAKDGAIYGTTHQTSQLFRYDPQKDELKLLGPCWLSGMYTTVMEASPDGKYLYYMPGAHGQAHPQGAPVVQYDIASGQQKVICFLGPALNERCGYVPGGTYGIKLSADGSTLYANMNGHPVDESRPDYVKPIGFGLTAFVAIHIPSSER